MLTFILKFYNLLYHFRQFFSIIYHVEKVKVLVVDLFLHIVWIVFYVSCWFSYVF
ncbi:hypothetical protein ['Cynodon dactylon' phytoplasma]|uniref:hypothetical protein n=1 Tax='Cynodon dactylon' phytoplasma TaxID=295320 RepID=UPI00186ABD12|nr:hypothetical protein ['Cynodon dactylon' phytoplasma]